MFHLIAAQEALTFRVVEECATYLNNFPLIRIAVSFLYKEQYLWLMASIVSKLPVIMNDPLFLQVTRPT